MKADIFLKNKLISTDFFPNFEADDYKIIKKLLLAKEVIEGIDQEILTNELKKFFPKSQIFLFNSERGALQKFLEFYLSKQNKEKVATQGFTCFVVPKAILEAGGYPIFLDIQSGSLNFDADIFFDKLKQHPDIKIVILQNTFGVPNEIGKILDIAREKNILVIENLAHAFGAQYKNIYLGNFGDVTLLTFGRSKVISGIFGGALIVHNQELAEEFKGVYKQINYPSKIWVKKALLYAYLLGRLRRNYNKINKFLAYLMRILKIIEPEISLKEYQKQVDPLRNYKMPNAFAKIAVNQIRKIFKFNEHREKIAKIYFQEGLLPYGITPSNFSFYYLRFPLTSNKKKAIFEKFKKYNIYLGNWYNSPLAPLEKRLDRYGYYYGMCPNAEKLCLTIYNLPTNILTTEEDAHLIAELLKKWKT